jgi:transcriptional regulator with XRE-family HTH domain
MRLRDARLVKRWSVRELAARAGVSPAVAYRVEAGEPTSLEALVRLSTALGLRIDVELNDVRRKTER